MVGSHASDRGLGSRNGKYCRRVLLLCVVSPRGVGSRTVKHIEGAKRELAVLASAADDDVSGAYVIKGRLHKARNGRGIFYRVVALDLDILWEMVLKLESCVIHVLLRELCLERVGLVTEDYLYLKLLVAPARVSLFKRVFAVIRGVFGAEFLYHFNRRGASLNGGVAILDKVEAGVRKREELLGREVNVPKEPCRKRRENDV